MNQNYNEVPNIISGKDLDYLSDMFNWNYGAYKTSVNSSNNVQDSELKQMIDKCANVFYENLNVILNTLNEGGQNE